MSLKNAANTSIASDVPKTSKLFGYVGNRSLTAKTIELAFPPQSYIAPKKSSCPPSLTQQERLQLESGNTTLYVGLPSAFLVKRFKGFRASLQTSLQSFVIKNSKDSPGMVSNSKNKYLAVTFQTTEHRQRALQSLQEQEFRHEDKPVPLVIHDLVKFEGWPYGKGCHVLVGSDPPSKRFIKLDQWLDCQICGRIDHVLWYCEESQDLSLGDVVFTRPNPSTPTGVPGAGKEYETLDSEDHVKEASIQSIEGE
ncbi:MAG: hypothetical protein M1837_007437 [Sclerophora amabilis]|nr:MAG: hypothetical protein M1837_007437 [Sclerophora amabilis]